jgi:enoyl-[acyl-carrier-protein] reductase (NADH)
MNFIIRSSVPPRGRFCADIRGVAPIAQTRAASASRSLTNCSKTKAPARRLVKIEDVGIAAAFLAHDAARLITGGTIHIDGG